MLYSQHCACVKNSNWLCLWKRMDFGNHLDDFGGRSRCWSKVHDESHPKPVQLTSKRCMLGSCQPCFMLTVSAPSDGACRYCLSENEFNNTLKVFETFSVWIFHFTHCFSLWFNSYFKISMFKLHFVLKSQFFLLGLILLSISFNIYVFWVLFLTFELLLFNGTRNMKHGTKFHFAGIYLSKYMPAKNSIFCRFIFNF